MNLPARLIAEGAGSSRALVLLLGAIGAIVLLGLMGQVPIRYNLRNLSVRWKTTLMTALAFTLVIALLVVMLAFVNGMRRLTEQSGRPENLIILSDGATDEIFSNLPASDVADLENQPGVARIGGRRLASRECYMVVNQPIPDHAPGRPSRRFLQLRGIDDATVAAAVHGIGLAPGGQWFSAAGVRPLPGTDARGAAARSAIEVVLGEGIAREMGRDRGAKDRRPDAPPRLDVGDTFQLGDRTWHVVGVMVSGGSTFDSEVWAKRSVIGPLFGKNNYTSVVVRADDAATARALRRFYTADFKKAAVQAQVETDYYAALSETNRQFLFAIMIVTVIMSVGGIFGVMNTMFAAIAQRTRDIGVMRLLGYGRQHILMSFLLESLAIALLGGVLGCLLGSLSDGLSATSVVSSGPGGGKFVVLRLAVDAATLGTGLLVSLTMGAVGGLLPALSSMRLRPLEALR